MKDHIEAIRERMYQHRQKVGVTCEGACWCWDVEALLTMIEVLQKEVSQPMKGKTLVDADAPLI